MRAFFRIHAPLFLLLAFAAILYSGGIFFEAGRLASVPDESHVVNSVLKFFRDWNFADPYAYAFPVMTILYVPFAALMFALGIMGGVVAGVSGLIETVIVDTHTFVPGFRAATIALSLLTLFFFYKFSEEVLASRAWALVATYLLATSFFFSKTAFIAVKWIPQTFLIIASLYIFMCFLRLSTWRLPHYALAGALVAFSYGIALVGLIVLVPFVFFLYHAYREGRAGDVKRGLIVFLLVLVVLMLALTFASPELARNSFLYLERVAEGGVGEPTLNDSSSFRFWGYVYVLALGEPLLFALAVLGVFFAWRRYHLVASALLAYTALYYFMLGPVMGAVRDRRMLPLLLVFALFGAVFVRWVWEEGKLDRAGKTVLILALVFLVANPLIVQHELSKASTMMEAKKWIELNLSENTLIFDECNLELEESLEKVRFAHEAGPAYETTKGKYVLEHPDVLEGRRTYFVITDASLLGAKGASALPPGSMYFVSCSRSAFGSSERENELEQQFNAFGISTRYPGAASTLIYDSAREGYLARDSFLYAKANDPWYVLARWNETNTGEHVRIFSIEN